ncbi:MAG: hypothetical protein AB7D51_01430 [Desulfovibrionaceae bacterium]
MIGISIDPYAIAKDAASFIRDKIKDDPELREKVFELNEALLNLHSQNIELRGEVEKLHAALKQQGELRFNKNYGTWEKEVNGEVLQHCPRCKSSGELVPMQETTHEYVCRSCGNKCPRPENPRHVVVALSRE